MVVVNAGVLKVAPVNTGVVKAASLYHVNTGLVTVVVLATKLADEPAQIVASAAITSVAEATGLTTTFTDLAVAALFSHLLSPLTVT